MNGKNCIIVIVRTREHCREGTLLKFSFNFHKLAFQLFAQRLIAQGADAKAAELAGATRIFASESGRYGTGLDEAALATDTWKGKAEGDKKLAQLYLSKMQFAYGPDEAQWGSAGVAGVGGGQGDGKGGGKSVNLYAEHLSGTEGAVLSRSSNLYGMLTTDDPFQYLGGIALAVRHLDGKAPELYISNLRGAGSGKVEGAAQFLAKELATRQFHPGYIQGLMKEGYAGTLQVLDATNNFWGWTATAREIVRDDQWQEMVDVYVRDKHNLGLKDWFESKNPHALAQTMERMLEAARQGYWQADPATLRELKERWRDLSQRFAARIQMVQVGSRDEAALLGGVGVCGQTLCCSTWLKDFRPISIQMAKRQNLSLNPSKISGQCGRLLCCLAYEDDQYKGTKRPKDAPTVTAAV